MLLSLVAKAREEEHGPLLVRDGQLLKCLCACQYYGLMTALHDPTLPQTGLMFEQGIHELDLLKLIITKPQQLDSSPHATFG